MNTRPQIVNAIDNVVVANSVVHQQQQRKRIGRPPKIRQQQQQQQELQQYDNHLADETNMEIVDNKTSTASLIDTSANECRRSSRKKFIKFDVREVLNKNRKSHKVQIEARIDSNIVYAHPNETIIQSDDESSHNSTFEINNTTAPPIVTLEPAKRGRPRLSLPNKICTVKRGRGRPPKLRQENQISTETTKHDLPEKSTNAPLPPHRTHQTPTSTPVTVLVKKLNLTHGQTYNVSGNKIENITINNVHKDVLKKMENEMNVANNEVDDEEEEELVDHNIIYEISSSSSSSSSTTTESSKNIQTFHTPPLLERRQRNFAAVSVLSSDETEHPEFIVAAVEEVVEEHDKEIAFELVNEDSENISEDSVILVLDMKDDEVNNSKSSPETVGSMENVVVSHEDYQTNHSSELSQNNSIAEESVNSCISSLNERNTLDGRESVVWEDSQTTLDDMIIESDSLIEVIVMDEETVDHVETLSDIIYETTTNAENIEKCITKEKEIIEEANLHEIEKEIIIGEIEDNVTIELGNNLDIIEQNESMETETEDNVIIVEEISSTSEIINNEENAAHENIEEEEPVITNNDSIVEISTTQLCEEVDQQNSPSYLEKNQEDSVHENLNQNTAINDEVVEKENLEVIQNESIIEISSTLVFEANEQQNCNTEQKIVNNDFHENLVDCAINNSEVTKNLEIENNLVEMQPATENLEIENNLVEMQPAIKNLEIENNFEEIQPATKNMEKENNLEKMQPATKNLEKENNLEDMKPATKNLEKENKLEKIQPATKNLEKENNLEEMQPATKNLEKENKLEKMQPNTKNLEKENNLEEMQPATKNLEKENKLEEIHPATNNLEKDNNLVDMQPATKNLEKDNNLEEMQPATKNLEIENNLQKIQPATENLKIDNNLEEMQPTTAEMLDVEEDFESQIKLNHIKKPIQKLNIEEADHKENNMLNGENGKTSEKPDLVAEVQKLEKSKEKTDDNENKPKLEETKLAEDQTVCETEINLNFNCEKTELCEEELSKNLDKNKLENEVAVEVEDNIVVENAASVMLRKTNSHKNSPSPNTVQRKRLEKRYEYVPEAARPKTMEEIFAEIAAQSSKVILEMAAVTKDDEPLVENEVEKIKEEELEVQTSSENDNREDSFSIDATENNLMVTGSNKKRGRKSKQKSKEVTETETAEKLSNDTKIVENEISLTTKITKKERRKSRWDESPIVVADVVDKNQRQIDLKEAFQAALSEVAKQTESENLENENYKLDFNDKTLPLMLYKSMSAKLVKDKDKTANNSQDQNKITNEEKQTTANPLSDIEKFIADGVNLLKRDYKITDEITNSPKSVEQAQEIPEKPTANIIMPEKEEEEEVVLLNTMLDIEEHIHEKIFETPADTPLVTPSATPPPKSPLLTTCLNYGAILESQGDDSAALRRSHRIKQITKAPKALVGRGLVREKERFALKSDMETKTYSLDDHLLDLAEVDAKNAKFLKEMEERLSNFQVIKENEYKCERIVSKEARKMICDCFLTREEESRGELGCGEDCLNRLLMIECGPNCNVKERCTNNRFQKYLCSPCRVFRTEKKGFGIMADIQILPGEFIMEYVGEVIDDDEFERRRTSYSKEKNRHYYFMALRSDAIIDATIKGNISRFINHSCDPNAETQKWTINGELRIGFFSRKSIMPGEEITFDYQYQRYGREAQRCYCESANCRGWIGEEPDSDECEQPEDDSDEDNLSTALLADDDEQTDEGESEDPVVVQRKLEYAAAAAKLMPLSDGVTKNERQKKKTDKMDDEDPTIKFRKLLSKISARVNNKQQKERRGRGRPPKTNKLNNKSQSPNKSRFIEDPDIEDEINFLRNCGLKNQSDTLSLSRLMVRAKLPQTRLNLLEVLRQGDEPCRRLFLDYHGLRLLHGWMSEDAKNMNMRLALLQTLMRLPIVNKTVLKESKVLQTVQNWSTTTKNITENNSSPSDESSKESTNTNETQPLAEPVENELDIQKEVEELSLKLCNIWDNLPEIFRIPKRERIEQMKEHEREADRQYEADLAVADKDKDNNSKDTEKHEDEGQLQRDRFRRDLNRYNKRPFSNRDTYIPNPFRRRSGYDSDETRHLSKEKRRAIFAARVAREEAEKSKAEKRREFDIKCRFFGLHRRRTHPQDVPFCVNTTTGQWYGVNRRPIPTPLNYIHAPPRPKIKSTNPNDYNLPVEALRLPKQWRFAITNRGFIYYYHVKYRRAQWHPPTAAQLADCRYDEYADNEKATESSDDEEIIKSLSDESQFRKYMEKKVQARKQKRRNHLVTETPISPRRDEDRLYNQQEVRKYKENKEKIRKRKEEIRRKKVEGTKQANKIVEDELDTSSKSKNKQNESKNPAALPIQEYLLSSDEEVEAEIMANNSLLLKIVEGDKIVDELDALMSSRRALKRPFDSADDLSKNNESVINHNQLVKTEDIVDVGKAKTSKKDKDTERYEQHKRRKLEKLEKKDKEKEKEKDKSKRNSTSNSVSSTAKELEATQRKTKEKFRCEIAGVIVHYLKPYLKSNCPCARITTDDDFNHLARKLTHFVMIKELKYCDSVGQKLVFTESVKNKSREFIRKYMAKYGETYKKPDNDPEFKDIPFSLKQSHENKTETNS